MKTRKRTRTPSAAALVAVLMSGAAVSAVAQTPKPPAHQHHEGHQGMSGMMGGAHHALAMGYRANLVSFARALGADVAQTKAVDIELARPAVAEMRRSFDLIQQHHQAHMAMMGGAADSTMLKMMKEMNTKMAALGEHLTALEAEVAGPTPDPRKVTEHTTEIVKHCEGMADMHGKAMPHQM
jgi:hypothetical protein